MGGFISYEKPMSRRKTKILCKMEKIFLKLGIWLIAFMVMNVFAQPTTMKVMKNGVAIFQSDVSEIEKIVFQDPFGSPTISSDKALIVNKSDGSSADKTLLDNIMQLTLSDGSLLVEPVIGNNNVFPFGNIAKLTFGNMTTSISNPLAQSLEIIAYVNSEGNIEVECAVEIKSLTLFSIDGKTVSTVEMGHSMSLQCLTAGIYLLAVETTQGTVVKKIVKQ